MSTYYHCIYIYISSLSFIIICPIEKQWKRSQDCQDLFKEQRRILLQELEETSQQLGKETGCSGGPQPLPCATGRSGRNAWLCCSRGSSGRRSTVKRLRNWNGSCRTGWQKTKLWYWLILIHIDYMNMNYIYIIYTWLVMILVIIKGSLEVLTSDYTESCR